MVVAKSVSKWAFIKTTIIYFVVPPKICIRVVFNVSRNLQSPLKRDRMSEVKLCDNKNTPKKFARAKCQDTSTYLSFFSAECFK